MPPFAPVLQPVLCFSDDHVVSSLHLMHTLGIGIKLGIAIPGCVCSFIVLARTLDLCHCRYVVRPALPQAVKDALLNDEQGELHAIRLCLLLLLRDRPLWRGLSNGDQSSQWSIFWDLSRAEILRAEVEHLRLQLDQLASMGEVESNGKVDLCGACKHSEATYVQ